MAPNKRNYQKELELILKKYTPADTPDADSACPAAVPASAPTLLLHSCCAPCSSYVLEYLSEYFEITVFYYNPNIYPETEYAKRVAEQNYLISRMSPRHPIHLIEGRFDTREFYQAVHGLEQIPEGGERCFACFTLRLEETARLAEQMNFDYFTTTLTISPLKNAAKLNEIGEALAAKYRQTWLPSDFKKKNGYKRSVELSAEYGLYRQDYCGCVFSKREQESRQK